MKKFFAIAVIATAMVACNNNGEKKGTDKDSTGKTDTATVTPPPADTATKAPADTAAVAPVKDTTAK